MPPRSTVFARFAESCATGGSGIKLPCKWEERMISDNHTARVTAESQIVISRLQA